jgi:nitroreductase
MGAGTHASPTDPPARLVPDLGEHTPLIEFARRAPSAHNSQPWRFKVANGRVDLLWDPGRELPHGDPLGRYLLIGLGAAAESVALGAVSLGKNGRVAFDFDRDAARAGWIEVGAGKSSAEDRRLAAAVQQRQTTRLPLLGEPVPRAVLDHMAAEAERPGCHLIVKTDQSSRRGFAELVMEGTARNFARKAVYEEFFSLLRLRASHPGHDRDGLTADALAMGRVQRTLSPLFLRPPSMRVLVRTGLHRIVARTQHRLALRSAAMGLLVCPSESPAALFSGGRAMLRMWLAATAAEVRVHPMTAPMDDPEIRAALAQLFGAPPEASMVACFRLGFGPAGSRSPRLPLEELFLDGGAASAG